MKWILTNPITHFFVLGFVVFGLHSFLNKDRNEDDNDPHTIEVTSADIEWLRSTWESRMRRKPTVAEFNGVLDAYIREEILSREAQTMGLDEQDLVIKRRLVQKLLFVFDDLTESIEPTDDDLKAYARDNSEKYRIPEMISFTQIYFSPDRRADVTKDAEITLADLREGRATAEEAVALGDAIMLDASYHQMTPERVASALGTGFAEDLFALDGVGWQGPISSSFGLHLVRISEYTDARTPEFEAVRERVRSDYMYDQKNKIVDEVYESVKSRYTILVEGLPRD